MHESTTKGPGDQLSEKGISFSSHANDQTPILLQLHTVGGERHKTPGKKLFSMSINNVTVQEADSELWYYKCLILHKISVDRKMLDVSGGVFIVFF